MESKEMRAAYAETLVELAGKDPNIVVLEADLMRATGTDVFRKVYPDRFFNVGIAEANLVGVAAGLSAAGKTPFAATFACFASRRAFDQFFLSANYARLNVKLVGTDPGVTAAYNGGTHMPFEDLALMRTIPGLRIVEPSDPVSCAAFVREAAGLYGCVYLRMPRKAVPTLYPEGERFEFGKAKLLREGRDVCFVALGSLMVNESMMAAKVLAAEGVEASVLDVLSLKPLDAEAVLGQARRTGAVVSAENHQIAGALGSAVAELLAEARFGGGFARVGIRDEFGEVGTQDYLAERFGLTAGHLAAAARSLLSA
ncbi:MAG: transketolase family protein [Spirochaetes bacterium]|nr:transketolase family protein [Spirochaetota bacterium]MBU1079487.1 transketolase family protein [Spirochaetota bacterium]